VTGDVKHIKNLYMYKTLHNKAMHSIHKNLHNGKKKLVKLLLTILYYLWKQMGVLWREPVFLTRS